MPVDPSSKPSVSIYIYIFFFERERAHVYEWEAGSREREGERERKIPSRLCVVSVEPDVGLDPMNLEIMT